MVEQTVYFLTTSPDNEETLFTLGKRGDQPGLTGDQHNILREMLKEVAALLIEREAFHGEALREMVVTALV